MNSVVHIGVENPNRALQPVVLTTGSDPCVASAGRRLVTPQRQGGSDVSGVGLSPLANCYLGRSPRWF